MNGSTVPFAAVPTVDLVTREESHYLEFKETLQVDIATEAKSEAVAHGTLKTVAAFLNSDGGVLLIGVTDGKLPVGLRRDYRLLPRKDADSFVLSLNQRLTKAIGLAATSDVRVSIERINDVEICRIDVPPHPEPVYLTAVKDPRGEKDEGAVYIRMNNSSRQLTTADAVHYFQRRRSHSFAAAEEASPTTLDALGRLSEFGRLVDPGNIDLLDDAIWPRQGTTLLGEGTPLCPYVPRTSDNELRNQLKAAAAGQVRDWGERVVALVGESKSGKTRSAVEALKVTEGVRERSVLWLRKPGAGAAPPLSNALAILTRDPARATQLTILVDDLQYHVSAHPDPVSYNELRDLAQLGVVIVTTLHPTVLKGWSSEAPTSDRPTGRPTADRAVDQRLCELLSRHRTSMSPAFDDDEARDAQEITRLPWEKVERLAESLVATDLVLRKVDAASTSELALIAAARLLSLASPDAVAGLALDELTRLWSANEDGHGMVADESERVLRWAIEPVVGAVRILDPNLIEVDSIWLNSFRLLDQLRYPIRTPSWLAEVVNVFSPDEVVSIALSGDPAELDEAAADKMLASVEDSFEAGAVSYLRSLIATSQPMELEHLRRAATQGFPEAMLNLAALLASHPDHDENEVRYWYGEASGNGEEGAKVELAEYLLSRSRSHDEGLDLLRQEAEQGVGNAFLPLAKALLATGDRASAAEWFGRAQQIGDEGFTEPYRDGLLAAASGEVESAERFYRLGISHGDDWCAYELARLYIERGDGLTDEVRKLLLLAVQAEHPVAAVALASQELSLDWSLGAAERYLGQLEDACSEESEEVLDYLSGPEPIAIATQLLRRGTSAVAVQLLLLADAFDVPAARELLDTEPQAFGLSPEEMYDVYLRLDDERWLNAAADAGHEPAVREIDALYGESEFDELEQQYLPSRSGNGYQRSNVGDEGDDVEDDEDDEDDLLD